jgi:hypothetical protein
MTNTQSLHLILLTTFVLCSHFATAQNDNSLKIYGNFLYASSGQTPMHFDHDDDAAFLYNHLSFAFRKEKATHSSEYELRLLFKSEARDNHKVTQFETSFGYEYGYELKKKLFDFMTVRFGGAGRLFYLREDIQSAEYNMFPVINSKTGVWVGAFAHLEFDITSRIYIDINTSPISMALSYNQAEVQDPALTVKQQTSDEFSVDAFGDRILRVGIGFRLGYMGGADEEDELQIEWEEKRKKKGKGKKKKTRKKKRRG